MTRKTQASYVHLFKCIEDEIVQLNPVSFMTDFETAMRNGLAIVYPTAKLFGCWFHFKRHGAQIQGFMAQVRDDPDKAKIYFHLLSLPLLPSHLIKDTFYAICVEANMKFGPKEFKVFFKYYEAQWIKKVLLHIFHYSLIL